MEGLVEEKLNAWAASEDIPSIATRYESLFDKKRRLYIETISIVEYLMKTSPDISSSSGIYTRFWDLYKRDLIGIESREVARAMVDFGKVLIVIENDGEIDSDKLSKLGSEVTSKMRAELETTSEM